MDRRAFVAGAALLLATPLAAAAQQATPRRIAVVFGRSSLDTMVGPQPSNPNMRAFVEGLRDLGYVEGGNLVIERRALEGRMEHVPTVIRDLLQLKVEVMLAAALDVALATQGITPTIPIVVVDFTLEGQRHITRLEHQRRDLAGDRPVDPLPEREDWLLAGYYEPSRVLL